MAATNKTELLALFADASFQGFSPEGSAISYTLFSNLDYRRAEAISQEISENVIDWLTEAVLVKQGLIVLSIDLDMVGFAQVCLRNVILNGETEVYHAIMHIGYSFCNTLIKLETLKNSQGGEL